MVRRRIQGAKGATKSSNNNQRHVSSLCLPASAVECLEHVSNVTRQAYATQFMVVAVAVVLDPRHVRFRRCCGAHV